MENKRLFYIDRLRVFVVLSLIPFHAALTYLRFGTVYIKTPVQGIEALLFLIFSVPLGDFFMTLLFFLSGIASFYSLSKRGVREYVGERVKKLLIPLLLGLSLLCPVTAYLKAIYEGFEGGLISFFPLFWKKIIQYLGYGHLWFILYLFVFSMLCIPLFNRWKIDDRHVKQIGSFLVKGHRILLPFLVIIIFELLLRPFFHGVQTLVFDWANDAVYLSVFIFGYFFAADERIGAKLKEYLKPSIICFMVSLTVLFYVNIKWQVMGSDELYLAPLWAVTKGIYECSVIIFLINAGKARFNNPGKVIQYLNRASFKIYIFHFFPVTLFTLLFTKLKIHIFLKYLLVVLLSYIAILFVYELCRRVHLFMTRIATADTDKVKQY